MKPQRSHFIFLLIGLLLVGCVQELSQCMGPELDYETLATLRSGQFNYGGPEARLVMPNPLEATRSLQVFASSSGLTSFSSLLNLAGLASPNRLENSFIRVRRTSISEAATVFSSSDFNFAVDSLEYSETMAYHSTTALLLYLEALGFKMDRSSPLFALIRSPEAYDGEINALFENNTFNPNGPRIIHMVGGGDYAPSIDANMYAHEFGHFVNTSATFGRGIDEAGAYGADFSEGAALEECLADYLMQSTDNSPYIGRWIARNFSEIPAGEPLRSAIDRSSDLTNTFTERILNDGTSEFPERYNVAEVCSRVLWEIREQFAYADERLGPILADRLVYTALGQLPQNASLRQFREALLSTDEQMHCGLNQRSISGAFASRGIQPKMKSLSRPLQIFVSPIGVTISEDSEGTITLNPVSLDLAENIYFQVQVTNPNTTTAHNVRMEVFTDNARFVPDVFMQGLGDIPGGATVTIGGQTGYNPYQFGVSVIVDRSGHSGSANYQLKVYAENGGETFSQGSLR